MPVFYSADKGFLCRFLNEKEYVTEPFGDSKKRIGKLIVTGSNSGCKTYTAYELVRKLQHMYDEVYHIVYDKEKHLYYGSREVLSVDCVLKKAIVRAVSKTKGNFDGNELDVFEKSLEKNTLVVVDNYNIAAISPYMRHIALSECDVILVSSCDIDGAAYGFEKICVNDDNIMTNEMFDEICQKLSDYEKELLMSLSAMLYYLGDETEIVSGKTGFFDRYSLQFYLGNISRGLDKLVEMKLVKERRDGKIIVEKHVCELVFSRLEPNTDNCGTLMKFFEEVADFNLSQTIKNTLGKACSDYEEIPEIAVSDELLELYTYFAGYDENVLKKLYNLLFVKVLENLSLNGESLYTHHLLTNNIPYFLEMLYNTASEEFLQEIYEEYFDDEENQYDDMIKFHLDTVRLCVALIRNLSPNLYDANSVILRLLQQVMTDILEETKDRVFRQSVIEQVVKIGYETFGCFAVVDSDGTYFGFREKANACIKYTCNSFSDREISSGLYMGYSCLTFSLYKTYFKYLELYDKRDAELNDVLELMYVHLKRTEIGYDSFYDFFDKNVRTFCCSEQNDLQKRLNDNKRYVIRGYDGGTKTGAKRYADDIVRAVSKSKNPFVLFKIVMNPEYNVSDYCCAYLLKNGFVKLAVESKHISNHSKQNLVLWLIDMFNETIMKENRRKLTSELIAMLLLKISPTAAFNEKLYHVVSSMYFENKTCNPVQNHGFADSLYERVCAAKSVKDECSDDYIANAVYNYLTYGKKEHDIDKLCLSFMSASYSYLTCKTDFNASGFFKLCTELCGYESASDIYEKIYMCLNAENSLENMLEMKK